MDFLAAFRLFDLFAHLILCCFALCYLLTTDVKILKEGFSHQQITHSAKYMYLLLIALWLTGLPIALIDTNFEFSSLLDKSKLLAKIFCVSVLTLNAFFLHFYAFPKLQRLEKLSRTDWRIIISLGAVSTSSWLCAAFLGIAKPLANYFNAQQFISFYISAVIFSVLVALLLSEKLYPNNAMHANNLLTH